MLTTRKLVDLLVMMTTYPFICLNREERKRTSWGRRKWRKEENGRRIRWGR